MKNVMEFERGIADGGAETLVKDYCILADHDRYNLIVVCLFANKQSANYELLRSNSVEMHVMYNSWNIAVKAFNYLFGTIYVSYKLRHIIKENAISVIHSHVGVLKYLSPIRKRLREGKVRLLYTCHNLPEKYFGKEQKREEIACKKLLRDNNLQLIALHEQMALELNEWFGINNTVVLNNGIDFNKYEQITEPKSQIRSEIGIPEKSFVIGNIGKFSRQKNHSFIIDIFREIQRKDQNTFLLLIGAGELEEKIRDQIVQYGLNDKVLILSHRKDIPRLLHAMDCFLFPSLFEGLGIVAVEAQKAGLKTVLADTVPNAAYLSPNIIVKSLSDPVESWANAVLYETPNYKNYGDMDKWNMRNIIKKIEDMYD